MQNMQRRAVLIEWRLSLQSLRCRRISVTVSPQLVLHLSIRQVLGGGRRSEVRQLRLRADSRRDEVRGWRVMSRWKVQALLIQHIVLLVPPWQVQGHSGKRRSFVRALRHRAVSVPFGRNLVRGVRGGQVSALQWPYQLGLLLALSLRQVWRAPCRQFLFQLPSWPAAVLERSYEMLGTRQMCSGQVRAWRCVFLVSTRQARPIDGWLRDMCVM